MASFLPKESIEASVVHTPSETGNSRAGRRSMEWAPWQDVMWYDRMSCDVTGCQALWILTSVQRQCLGAHGLPCRHRSALISKDLLQ